MEYTDTQDIPGMSPHPVTYTSPEGHTTQPLDIDQFGACYEPGYHEKMMAKDEA